MAGAGLEFLPLFGRISSRSRKTASFQDCVSYANESGLPMNLMTVGFAKVMQGLNGRKKKKQEKREK